MTFSPGYIFNILQWWKLLLIFEEHARGCLNTTNRSVMTYLFATYILIVLLFFPSIVFNVQFINFLQCKFGVRTIDYSIIFYSKLCFRCVGCTAAGSLYCKWLMLNWILEVVIFPCMWILHFKFRVRTIAFKTSFQTMYFTVTMTSIELVCCEGQVHAPRDNDSRWVNCPWFVQLDLCGTMLLTLCWASCSYLYKMGW